MSGSRILTEIKLTNGGPFVYAQGVMHDGTLTGKVRLEGQTEDQLRQELIDTLSNGRDDVVSFVSMIV